MNNWLDSVKYLFANSSVYVQLAVMGVQILLKYAPPLFELISNLVDEGFDLIEAAKKAGGDVKVAQRKARETAVETALNQFPDVPESRIRGAIEDMVDVKKVIRAGTDESRGKEAHAVQKGVVNIYEVERLKEAYPQLFGESR